MAFSIGWPEWPFSFVFWKLDVAFAASAPNAYATRGGESRSRGRAYHAGQFRAEFFDDFLRGRIGTLPVFVGRLKLPTLEFPFLRDFRPLLAREDARLARR